MVGPAQPPHLKFRRFNSLHTTKRTITRIAHLAFISSRLPTEALQNGKPEPRPSRWDRPSPRSPSASMRCSINQSPHHASPSTYTLHLISEYLQDLIRSTEYSRASADPSCLAEGRMYPAWPGWSRGDYDLTSRPWIHAPRKSSMWCEVGSFKKLGFSC